mgnify:FL=1
MGLAIIVGRRLPLCRFREPMEWGDYSVWESEKLHLFTHNLAQQ